MTQTPLPMLPGKGCWLSQSLSPASLHLSSLLRPSSDEKEKHLKTALGILLTGGSSLMSQVSKGILVKVGDWKPESGGRTSHYQGLGERLSCNVRWKASAFALPPSGHRYKEPASTGRNKKPTYWGPC